MANVGQFLWPRTFRPRQSDWRTVRTVRELASQLVQVSDRELADRTGTLRDLASGGSERAPETQVVPGFALVTEAVRRVLGLDLYDVQLLAGLILTGRNVAEMRTGEGKTFVVSLPAFVHALCGQGVHVATANDYLAQRDYELLAPVFRMLGISVGLVRAEDSPEEKQAAYACDVTYGADQEFGFDYLRDQVALLSRPTLPLGRQFRSALHGEKPATVQTVQRGLAVAIIDEVDSVLLDSSTSPLLLSLGPEDARQEVLAHHLAQSVARQLVRDVDFFQDTTSGLVSLTEAGTKKVFGGTFELPRHGLCRPWSTYVEQALKAEHLLRKDVEYVVQAGKVLLVDECTGRIFSERRWRDGLHQAVETKEGLAVNAENRPVARISKQRYFSLYGRLCGMTGTAQESAREFWSIYRLRVVVIPPRRPCRRKTYPARLFGSADAKYVAMVREIQRIHRERQPILVGTRTIESSERVARLLDASGIPYRILNGKQDLTEAAIIAQAGEVGAVTIATNMAGRGTDIHLRPGAADLGGLHVIAAEPNESVRVDRQLVGRAARQGDVGSSQIFISAEDPLIVKFAPALGRLLQGLSGERGELIVDLSQEVTRLQRRVEWTQYLSRRRLLRNDNWLQEVLSKWAGHVPEPH